MVGKNRFVFLATVLLPATASLAALSANVQFEPTGATGGPASAWSAAVWTNLNTGASSQPGPNDILNIRTRLQGGENIVTDGNYGAQRVYFNGGAGTNTLTVATGNTLSLATYNDTNSSLKYGANGANTAIVNGTISGTGELAWQADGNFIVNAGGNATFGGITFIAGAYTPNLTINRGGSLTLSPNTAYGSTELGGVTGTQATLSTTFSGDAGGFGTINAASYAEFGTLKLVAAANTADGVYNLITTSGALTGAFAATTFNGSAYTSPMIVGGKTYALAQSANALTLTVSSVPEPTTLAALAGATLLTLRRRR